jgi:uncharacterized protein GlcG (DUF336 family)
LSIVFAARQDVSVGAVVVEAAAEHPAVARHLAVDPLRSFAELRLRRLQSFSSTRASCRLAAGVSVDVAVVNARNHLPAAQLDDDGSARTACTRRR